MSQGRRHSRTIARLAALTLIAVLALLGGLGTPRPASGAPDSPTASFDPPARDGEQTPDRPEFVEGELLVRFEPNTPENARAQVRARQGLQKIESLPLPGLELVRTTRPTGLPDQAAEVARERSVRYAEPNRRWYPAGHAEVVANDPEFTALWGLRNTGQTGGTPGADTDAPRAWSVSSGSEQVVVGVIDTGTMVDHPDLAESIWLNVGELPLPQNADGVTYAGHDANGDGIVSIADYADDPRVLHPGCSAGASPVPTDLMCAFADGVDTDGNGFVDDLFGWDFWNGNNVVYDELDNDAHGTHVSGTIAALSHNGIDVAGVSQARIMPLKFLGPQGGTTDGAVKAIDYAIKNGADLTNNSWGGSGFSQALRDKIEESNTAGMLFVAAAGNSGNDNDSTPSYPASYGNANIVAVAATDRNDGLASFSNYGATSVDLGAPGVSILSTVPGLTKAVLVGPDAGATVSHRIAYHTFGLEGVSSSDHRRDLLTEALGTWMGLAAGAPILLVDDDNGATFETAYQDALTAVGFTNVTTNTVATHPTSCVNGPSAAAMASYEAVIWFTGSTSSCTLSGTDQTSLATYLDSGGNLALFGVDIGHDLTQDGGVANTFYRDVLRTDYIADNDANLRLRAMAGTPYAGVPNLQLTPGTSGAGQTWSDAVAPRSGAVPGLLGAGTTWFNGTSMAAPHVAGAAAQVHAAYPDATHLQVRDRLIDQGDPTSSLNGKTVSGNRLNLANALDTTGPPVLTDASVTPESFDPTVGEVATLSWTQNEPGHVTMAVTPVGAIEPIFSEELGPRAAGTSTWVWDGTNGFLVKVANGAYTISVSVTDAAGAVSGGQATVEVNVSPVVSAEPQGDWVGAFGSDGWVLAAWDGSSDLVGLPAGVALTVEEGSRYRWSTSTTERRGLQAPDGWSRRAATWFGFNRVRVRLDFADAYSGVLRLYAVDWNGDARRQTVTVFDGVTSRSVELGTSFNGGAWVQVPVDVAAGASLVVTVDKTGGANAVLSGVFLGDAPEP